MMNANKIADIHCPACGAPAAYDIRSGVYACQYCGGKVTVSESQEEKRGFREWQRSRLRESAADYQLMRAACSGCGAEIIFEENEALAECAFCGRTLIRKKYLHKKDLPETVIPFQITEKEARELLSRWCEENRGKKEAKRLSGRTDEVKGFYLPYEFLRGPVSCRVKRCAGGREYTCGGFVDEVFVNCSGQLDNLLLDGMEPFDVDALTGFDFAYVAGHRVKTGDISGKELERRVREEVGESYTPAVRKVLETRAVKVDADVSSLLRMPALLPVYVLSDGDLMAAVNGQTGKVSVRALKQSYFFFLPWWLKSVFAVIAVSAAAFTGFFLAGAGIRLSLFLTAVLAFFIFIVTLAAYSDTEHLKFRVERGHKVFTSGGRAFVRRNGALTETSPPGRSAAEPVFFETLDGKRQEVEIRFSSPAHFAGMLLTALTVLFLPVISALFLNGFCISQLDLRGSAAWFCIFVPVIPIYLLKFGGIERYSRPWIYTVAPDGKKRRYRDPKEPRMTPKDVVITVLKLLIRPPACLAVWFAIACFCAMTYLTAFGL